MNDNNGPPGNVFHGQQPAKLHAESHIAELLKLATRAVTKPESLTMGEVQEVGWGVLMVAMELQQKSSDL